MYAACGVAVTASYLLGRHYAALAQPTAIGTVCSMTYLTS
jgi:hypothetical protein